MPVCSCQLLTSAANISFILCACRSRVIVKFFATITLTPAFSADLIAELVTVPSIIIAITFCQSFFNALSIFQSMTVTIKKTGLASFPTKNNGRTEYTYAKLEDITRVIRPSLKEAGLSYRYEQSSDNNLMTVVCIVTHKEGHQERTSMSAFAESLSGSPDHQIKT